MLFVQWYSILLLLLDAGEVLCACVGSRVYGKPLSEVSLWFDARSDEEFGVELFALLIAMIALSRVFVLIEPLSRWLLLSATVTEGIRLFVFSLLFSVNDNATSKNTMLLTFMLWNAFVYGRNWYTTMISLAENANG